MPPRSLPSAQPTPAAQSRRGARRRRSGEVAGWAPAARACCCSSCAGAAAGPCRHTHMHPGPPTLYLVVLEEPHIHQPARLLLHRRRRLGLARPLLRLRIPLHTQRHAPLKLRARGRGWAGKARAGRKGADRLAGRQAGGHAAPTRHPEPAGPSKQTPTANPNSAPGHTQLAATAPEPPPPHTHTHHHHTHTTSAKPRPAPTLLSASTSRASSSRGSQVALSYSRPRHFTRNSSHPPSTSNRVATTRSTWRVAAGRRGGEAAGQASAGRAEDQASR